MKKIMYIIFTLVALASNEAEAQKKYVTLSGKIINKNTDFLMVATNTYSKKMTVNGDGMFSDTLMVAPGYYTLYDGKEQTKAYLKNGYDLKITLDTKQFDETIKYSGIGEAPNNYLAKTMLLNESELEDQSIFDLEKGEFEKKIKTIIGKFNKILKDSKNLDAAFREEQSKEIEGIKEYLVSTFEQNLFIKTVLKPGNDSPKFTNYENYDGGITSLDDLKGKYVYMDIWATWCGPCKAEIPFLKEIEKKYEGKNIHFVSISVDEAKSHDKWKAMVKEKDLEGIQLLADKNFESDFVKSYKINGIPRFILLDPQGKIVNADAPRPSDEKLTVLFNELKI